MPEPIQPATDEQIAEWLGLFDVLGTGRHEGDLRGNLTDHAARSLIARIRQAEDRLALSRASRDNCHERGLAMRAERDEALAEAARLREQVAAMQAADAGAFW